MSPKRTQIKLFRNPSSFQIKVRGKCDTSSLDEEPVPNGGVSANRELARSRFLNQRPNTFS